MEGYFNFGFTDSFRQAGSRLLAYRLGSDSGRTSEAAASTDWNCDSVERSSVAELDTDLDSDSFLSDLEQGSLVGEEGGGGGGYTQRQWDGAVEAVQSDCAPAPPPAAPAAPTAPAPPPPLPAVHPRRLSGLGSACLVGMAALAGLLVGGAGEWLTCPGCRVERLGLWALCTGPAYTASSPGCFQVWHRSFPALRASLLSPWFTAAQAAVGSAMVLSLAGRGLALTVWVHRGRVFPLPHGPALLTAAACCDMVGAAAGLMGALAGWAALSPHPATSPGLSWAGPLTLLAASLHCLAAVLLVRQAGRQRGQRERNETFLKKLQQ